MKRRSALGIALGFAAVSAAAWLALGPDTRMPSTLSSKESPRLTDDCVVARGDGFSLSTAQVNAIRAMINPPPPLPESVEIALSAHLLARDAGVPAEQSTRALLSAYRQAAKLADPRAMRDRLARIRERLKVVRVQESCA